MFRDESGLHFLFGHTLFPGQPGEEIKNALRPGGTRQHGAHLEEVANMVVFV